LPPGIIRASDIKSPPANRFLSPKTPEPVFFARRWHLDGLRGLSLDASVSEIRAYDGDATPPADAESVVGVQLADGPMVVAFSRNPIPEMFCGSLPFRSFTRTEVEAEPQWTTMKSIWSAAGVTVDPADRVRLLRKAGGSRIGVQLSELADLVKWPFVEPVHAILSLVVEGELIVDLRQRLKPETLVRRGDAPCLHETSNTLADDSEATYSNVLFKNRMADMQKERRLSGIMASGKHSAAKTTQTYRTQVEMLLPISGSIGSKDNPTHFGCESMTSGINEPRRIRDEKLREKNKQESIRGAHAKTPR
jgi:hypothetical protein